MKYLKTVKADAKGRITGATPEEEYTMHSDGEGGFYVRPKIPRTFDIGKEVSYEQFTEFFGCPPSEVNVEGFQIVNKRVGGEYLPHVIAFQKYKLDKEGGRMYIGGKDAKYISGPGSALKEDVIIKVRKQVV